MLELTKKPRTDGMVEICTVVPASRVDAVTAAIEAASEPLYPLEDVFPESTPASRLKGARSLRELTQAELARAVDVRPSHISEMEHGKRAISKPMAKKLAEVLKFSYKVFL